MSCSQYGASNCFVVTLPAGSVMVNEHSSGYSTSSTRTTPFASVVRLHLPGSPTAQLEQQPSSKRTLASRTGNPVTPSRTVIETSRLQGLSRHACASRAAHIPASIGRLIPGPPNRYTRTDQHSPLAFGLHIS